MKLQTTIEITAPERLIGLRNRIAFIGSCFAQHIGERMRQSGLPALVNPFGVLYNPLSILQVLTQNPTYAPLYFEDEDDKPTITELWRMHGVIRCLSDSDRNYELKGNDEAFALTLLKSDGVIGKTQVYREGDRIRICDGAFEGLETRIVKVDHRGSRMMIEIPFAKQLVRTWVEYEIVELKE